MRANKNVKLLLKLGEKIIYTKKYNINGDVQPPTIKQIVANEKNAVF